MNLLNRRQPNTMARSRAVGRALSTTTAKRAARKLWNPPSPPTITDFRNEVHRQCTETLSPGRAQEGVIRLERKMDEHAMALRMVAVLEQRRRQLMR